MQHLAEALTLDRILTTVVAACGLAALLLATVGVYGVVGDAVRRRTPEIGLRVALGAPELADSAAGIQRGPAADACRLSRWHRRGSAADARCSGRSSMPFLRSTSPASPVVPVALLLVVLGAAALPTRRALRVSPTIALRADG